MTDTRAKSLVDILCSAAICGAIVFAADPWVGWIVSGVPLMLALVVCLR